MWWYYASYISYVSIVLYLKNSAIAFRKIAATAANSLDTGACGDCVAYILRVQAVMWWRDSAYTRNVAFPFNSRESTMCPDVCLHRKEFSTFCMRVYVLPQKLEWGRSCYF